MDEDYDYGMEMVENADFAQDDDAHNMYPTEDGFWTNQTPEEAQLQDIIENPDPVNEWESEAFFQGY